jgi:hypothetical protein
MELEAKGVQLRFELPTISFATLQFNHKGSWKMQQFDNKTSLTYHTQKTQV